MYVCMYVCMYVYMYKQTYIYIYIYIFLALAGLDLQGVGHGAVAEPPDPGPRQAIPADEDQALALT